MNSTFRRAGGRTAATLALLTTVLLQPVSAAPQDGDGDGGGGCPLVFEDDPFPPIDIVRGFCGFLDAGYSKQQLWEPGLIPLGIELVDTDTKLVKCNGSCTRVFYGNPVNAYWTILGAGPGRGSFVDAYANQFLSDPDGLRTLYLPPSDLLNGQSRTIVVRGTGFDECGEDDPDAHVDFTVKVTRGADGLFAVDVTVETPQEPTFDEKECIELSDGGCDLLMSFNLNPPPSVSICSGPGGGMVISEVRPFDCYPIDQDTLYAECGTPPGTQPVIHNGGQTQLCDSMTYKWSWYHTTGQTGTGFFMKEDNRAPLFCALTPGFITVEVQITTSDGEVATSAPFVFEIHEPKPKELSFDTTMTLNQDVFSGTNVVSYSAPHWKDTDGDGTATQQGERHFPVAFKKSEKVKVKSMGLSLATMPMPGLHLSGTATGATQTHIVYGFTYNPANPSGSWFGDKSLTDGALFTVSRYFANYTIPWLIGCTGGQILLPCGQTDNKLFVIHGAPMNPNGGLGYTAFELACRLNDNVATPDGCRANIWSEFSGRHVKRVTPDGFNNNVTQADLTYWINGPGTGVFDEQQMLNTGDGTCGAWARFFGSVLALQGIDYKFVEIVPNVIVTPARTERLYVNSWFHAGPPPYAPNGFQYHQNLLGTGGANDLLGLPGQGNPDPTSRFNDHAVVRSGNSIYDPSYGGNPFPGWPAAAQAAWEAFSLYGWTSDCTSAANILLLNKAGVDLKYN